MAQPEVVLQPRPAQIEIAVAQTHVLGHRLSSAIWNGGVFASFSTRISRASTSTSPVASFGLTVSAERRCTTPCTPMTYSGRSRLAAARSASFVADDDLRDARAIADVDEGHAAEIAHAMHPAEQHHVRADVVRRSAPQVCVR